MNDIKSKELAQTIVKYSLALQKNEKVLIETNGPVNSFINELIKSVFDVGALPILNLKQPVVERTIMMGATKALLSEMYELEAFRMERMDAYIGVRYPENASELADVPFDKQELYNNIYSSKLHMEIRCPKTRWVVLKYPTPAMAQAASMSTEGFSDFYFNACNVDYQKMSSAMDPLKELMEKTDKVRIIGPETNLEFSIKGMTVVKCCGNMNIPDGEVFTAPLRESANGYLTYNTPSIRGGFTYENIQFKFKDGKIIHATANDSERINQVLDLDEGARYIGEFAIGVNPHITKPMKDTLFDEKIMGSIHITPGNSVVGCDNGNKSDIHWDLVLIQTPEWGGGEIWFDDALIRKDGMFVHKDLLGLNPENLK
ncbi:MAG: aminopeptidase [Eubacteriales bacterium]|nr:aminopeptidase [Eubacteriales bacterium]